jgi:metal-responsive CopG/Arc/MetJ family transcriptional regulator
MKWDMKTEIVRTHVVIPQELVAEIDRVVGKRERSRFLTQAASKELMRRRQLAALEQATGAWPDESHPELKRGSAAFVRKLRRESERRLKKASAGR